MHLDELFNPLLNERATPVHAFKAIFVMGPPGAGKNTIIDMHLDNRNFKIDDFDDVMQRYKILYRRDNEYAHSYKLANQRRNLWTQNFLGIIINTTGRRVENIVSLKETLEKFGYDTFGIFIKAPYDVALQRVKQRPATGEKVADRGRVVDDDYFDKAYVASLANLKVFKTMFDPLHFAVVVNDPNSAYHEPSLLNLKQSIKRFIQSPVQNPVGKEKLSSLLKSQ